MTAAPRLGIDIGGTKTAVALVGAGDAILALRTAPSGRGPVEVVDVAVRLVREIALYAGGLGAVTSIGACMPGLVDRSSGVVRHAVNLDVESLDLRDRLERDLGLPVAVENDVKAAALGAWRRRVATPPGDARAAARWTGEALAYLNLGTGLASAVVRDGRVVRGMAGVAGEIGHLPVAGDVPCRCGQVGCLETIASGAALARLWPAERRLLRDPFRAAAAGDLVAGAAVDVLASGVGLAVLLLALASGAERVVVGGGVAALGDPLLEAVRADLTRRDRSSHLVAALGLADRVELLPAGLPVAALGAAWLASDGADGILGSGRAVQPRVTAGTSGGKVG